MAEIKTLLKEARKLIDDKNYKEAQDCCKNILRKDKQNYFALVLLGKALDGSDQVPLAYQKAIACKPDQPLAWQGLAYYYESKDEDSMKIKLFQIYEHILKLEIDEEKALEILTKLGQLGCQLKNSQSILILLNYIMKEHDNKLTEAAESQLLELLKLDVPLEDEHIPAVLNILDRIYNKNPTESIELLQSKVILLKANFSAAVEEVVSLKYFHKNVVLREWLCKYLCQKYIQDESFCNFQIENHLENIIAGVLNSKYPKLLKSIVYYEKGSYLEAYKQAVTIINYHEADVMEATFILNCSMKLKKWSLAQKLATNFLAIVKDCNFEIQLKRYLFVAMARQQKWRQAIAVIKEIPLQSLSIAEQAVLAECYIEVNEPADNIIKDLQSTTYHRHLQALTLLKHDKFNEVIKLLETSDKESISLFYLGQAYWKLKQYDKCLVSLLKAAKLNPDHAYTFLYLGHFYCYHKEDLEKAKKCYEKAFNLNNMDDTIALNLSNIYTKLQMRSADFEFLFGIQENRLIDASWIAFRLGLHCLNKRDWEKAILNFRNVIKNNQNDVAAFECLADAYYGRGSFTSALRAYHKVITLDLKREAHCQTRIGYIHSVLTQYGEAISTFHRVLQIEPHSLLALKGISETWMRIAQKKESVKLFGSARDCAQTAICYITKALTKQRQFTCFWKLLAEALLFITKLPNTFSFVFIKHSFKDSNNETKIEKLDIFPQAIACYSLIAKQKQEIASYDLASTYLSYYHESKNMANCIIAFNLTISCIQQKSTAWRNWNLLGKICFFMNKFDIAQHCFIKALMITRKWSVAKIWCNLGTLYLKLNHHKLANYCFWRGQSTLPSYPQSWIGQGLIAEQIREDEAMDLFRHASRLGYHPESALGYADWVCRTLRKHNYKVESYYKYVIEGLHAIPYAMDLVEWYTSYDSNNPCALTILGILQERSGLLRAALKTYEKAFKNAGEDNKNTALLNYARILLRMERYEEAIIAYKAITEASTNSAYGLALALFKKGLYEESYSAYDTALHWLSNDDNEKADLLVAMAGIMYMFKGADDAKTLLFHSIQVSQKKPTTYSLFAICSLGIMHSDQSLSTLAISELQKYEKDNSFGYDIGFLKSYTYICQDNLDEAIKLLSESLHDHPSNGLLWFCMAQYCLGDNKKAKVVSRCAQRALWSAQYSKCNCDSAKMISTASVAEQIAGNHAEALLLAKRGLHMYPSHAEIWAALLFSLSASRKWTEKKDWLIYAASHMRRRLEISRPLSRWVGFIEKKLRVQ